MAKAELRSKPWIPPAYELADVSALQALEKGTANADQQRRALAWIVNVAAARDEMSYRPGAEDGRRDTDFAEGRRFVGNQVVKLLRLPLASLPRHPNADPHDPQA